MKKELTERKHEELSIFLGIQKIQEWKNSGLHGRYAFAGSREKENFYTVDNVFSVLFKFPPHLNHSFSFNHGYFLPHTTPPPLAKCLAKLAVNTTAHSSVHTNLASTPQPQHWNSFIRHPKISITSILQSLSLDFWNSMILLNTPSFLKHFLKYHTFSQPLLPSN